MGAGIEYFSQFDPVDIEAYEQELLHYATETLKSNFPEIKIYGDNDHKVSVISFLLGAIHPYDTGTILDKLGIAVRTGHHCTQPVMKRYEIPGTVRASLAFYNTKQEVDRLIEGLHRVKMMFG